MASRRRVFLVAVFAAAAALSFAAAATVSAAPGDRIWVRSYSASTSGEEFLHLARGPQGSVYAVGAANAPEESGKLLVARYGADGSLLWARTYGAGAGAYGRCLVAVPGGVIVAGTAGNSASDHRRDILVVKYSASGRRLWTTRYDGPGHRDDTATCIDLGSEETVCVGGTSVGAATGRDYVVLQVHVPSGRIIWTRRYDGPGTRDEPRGLHADGDGDVYVTGESADGGGSTAAATLMYDIGGRRLWVRRLHTGAGPTSGTAVTIDIDEQAVYVAGSAEGGMSSGREVILAKLSMATGARQWIQTAGVPDGDEECLALAASGVHGWAIAGSTSDRVSGESRGFVAAWTKDGAPLWQDTFDVGLPGSDAVFTTAARDSSGAVYCGGFTSGNGASEDFTVVKYDVNGAVEWSDVYDGAAQRTDLCRDILVRGSGVYACGVRGETLLDTSALLVKYER